MNPYQFLRELNRTPAPGGDGVRVSIPLNIASDVRTAAGLVLDGSTTSPTIAAAETNGLAINCAASTTVSGSFVFEVPQDYDKTSDELKIKVVAASQGATDSPALSATVYRKRVVTALSADLAPTAAGNVTGDASPANNAAEYTLNVSGKGCQAGDVLKVNLVLAAHTTDAVKIYAIRVEYKSAIVFADPTLR